MTLDEKVEKGKEIATKIEGIILTEWRKWIEAVDKKGLPAALNMAEKFSSSPSMRQKPRETYKTILKLSSILKKIPRKDLLEVLGYATRWLVSKQIKKI